MRRILVSAALIGGLAAMAISHDVSAAPPRTVPVGHVNSSNTAAQHVAVWVIDYNAEWEARGYVDARRTETRTYHLGRVINVKQNAVYAHRAHGDSTRFLELTDFMAGRIEDIFDLPNTASSATWEWGTETFIDTYTAGEVGNANCYWITNERVWD